MLRLLLRSFLGLAILVASTLPSSSQTYCDCLNAGTCPVAINDNSTTTTELLINVSGAPDLASCPLESVCLTISHSWIGDLSVSLQSPNGEHYLIMADVSNSSGGCGTDGDNIEICITTGTNHPLTNGTEYACNPAPCSLGDCCLNGNWTVPCATMIFPPSNAVVAPNCDLNDFNLTGAPVNGIWTLVINDICSQDVGILQNFSLNFACGASSGNGNCLADGGILGMADAVFCGTNSLDPTPHFCAGPPPNSLFSYAFVIAQNDEILAFAPTPDLAGYPIGLYEIWGFSYENGAAGQLAALEGTSLQAAQALFLSSSPPFCGDFSGDNFMVNVIDLPSVNAGPDLVLDCWETQHNLSAAEFPVGSNFTYAWSSPSGQVTIGQTVVSASESGDYIFSATDSLSGCTISDTVNLVIPPPLIADIVTTPANCNQADGTASVELQPGITNAGYAWSNGASTQTNDGLAQGWYSVTVSDNYCSYHQNFYVDEDLSCKVVIKGKVLNDGANQDCLTDNSTIGVQCIMLHLLPADIYTYSQADGSYEFVVDAGDYTIEYIDEDQYELLCPVSGNISVSLLSDGSISEGNNFYTKKEHHPNLCINMCFGPARPGFNQSYHFQYCNLGTEPTDAVITLVHDPLLEDGNLSSVANAYDPATHTATWTIQGIPPGACQTISYYMQVPTTLPIGTLLSGNISIEPIANDPYPSNNFADWIQVVTNSYDPNEKSSLTGENQWGGLINDSDSILTYQVLFQNTGTDTAFTVIVRDTLDANLDVETIRPGMASHPYQLQFEGDNVLVFNFQNIQLPDSSRNEPASHGYVTFSIKRNPGLTFGAEIHNSAAIFFDYNSPIITNSITHTVGKHLIYSEEMVTLCYGEPLNGTVYEADSTFITTYIFASYDSIVTTNVDVLPPITFSYFAPICEGSSYFFNNQNLTATGVYEAVLPAANGCDSMVTLTLSVLPSIETNLAASICEGETFDFNGTSLGTAGAYQHTSIAVGGCDSTVTLTLTVLPTVETNMAAEICTGQSYPFNGEDLTTTGVYEVVLPSANGCDSSVTLTLMVLPTVATNLTAEICAGQSYPFNGEDLTTTGVYEVVFPSANGCDSTVTLSLTVLPVFTTNLSAEICDGDTYLFNGQVLTQSGDYQALLTALNGCDSLVSMHLEVQPTFTSTQQFEILLGSTWNGVPIFSDTTIVEVFTAKNGCDSIVTTHLLVLTNTRNLEETAYDMLVFPNPFDASATVELSGGELGKLLIFKLLDVTGRVVQQYEFRSPNFVFKREGLPSGLYFIKIETDGNLVALGRIVAK